MPLMTTDHYAVLPELCLIASIIRALRATEWSPGYYNEGALHNGAGVPAPCCAITLDGRTVRACMPLMAPDCA